ncbi:MAG: hypothetical protein GVY36_08045 [Verrucomicrobia bacterium]|nr:hypothetical protein [Verrucomicrobiota bacterium]
MTDHSTETHYRPEEVLQGEILWALDEALRSLAESACRQTPVCAVVGPKGTGKTTLLEDLDQIARESFLANAGNAREVFRSCYLACARW